MKLKGQKLDAPKELILVLPRENNEDIVFKFKAIVDDSTFDTLCKMPEMPMKLVKGGNKVPNLEDPGYKILLNDYARDRLNWMFLTSISATTELEWETVNLQDRTTWDNWKKELRDSGISIPESNLIWAKFTEANSLDNSKIEEARQRFLATQSAKVEV